MLSDNTDSPPNLHNNGLGRLGQNDLKRTSTGSAFPPQVHIPNQGSLIDLANSQRLSLPNDGNNNNHNHTMSKCGLCPSAFASAAALNDHLRHHHKLATGRALPCQHCDVQCLTIGALVQHQEQEHAGMEAKGDLICAVCNSAFKNLVTYYAHIKTHDNLFPFASRGGQHRPEEGAKLELSNGDLEHDGQSDQEELELNAEEESDLTKFFAEDGESEGAGAWRITCDACGGKFMREEVYQYHLLLHRGERPYSCGECAKAFKSRPVLMLHETCHSQTEQSQEMVSHNGYLNGSGSANGMTYHCSICVRVFDNKTALREHEMMHAVGGEFTCKVCGKKFRSLIGLKIHSNKHQNDLLQQHLNGTMGGVLRQDAVPSDGSGTSSSSKNLLYYEEVDGLDKERPYVCRVCDKRFKTKHALPYHMLLHTAETPFICEFCGKGFRALISLKLHAKKHEGKGWNPSFDHLELVQRQYQQQILMMGETRSVTQPKPPAITEVIPFAQAVAMAPLLSASALSMGRGPGVRQSVGMNGGPEEYMEGDGSYIQRRGDVSRDADGDGEGDMERDQDEPNIHDFCAVEMMMEPEVEINEFDQRNNDHNNKVPEEGGEQGHEHDANSQDMDESGCHNGSQYAHLLDDDEPMMMKNEAKSEDEHENGGEEDEDDDDDRVNEDDHEDHQQINGLAATQDGSNLPRPNFNTEELLEKAMQPMAINSILKYECPICLKRFKNRLSLPYHMMTHERGDPVNCNYCNRKFVSKMKLKRHLRVKHDIVDPSLGEDENEEPKPPVSRFGKFKFACPTCNRKFKSKFTLKLHMKHHHLVRGRIGRPPKASIVNTAAMESLKLALGHVAGGDIGIPQISKVESVPPYFSEASAMLQSLMNKPPNDEGSAHGSAIDAQFDCDQCEQKFVTFAQYKLHMKFHLQEIASAATVAHSTEAASKPKVRYDMQNSYRLSKEYEHLRIKDGRYQCNICHKIFKCRQSLPYHMNLHKKNGIFRCLSCKTGFRNLHGFKMHNRIYHKDRLESDLLAPQLAKATDMSVTPMDPSGGYSQDQVVNVKQELNTSGEHMQGVGGQDHVDNGDESSQYSDPANKNGDDEHSLGSSGYNNRNHNNNNNQNGDDNSNCGSLKQEHMEDMDLSAAALSRSMTADQMMNHPFSLFPPALLQLQQFQQLQLQMQQQMGQNGGGGGGTSVNGGGSSAGSEDGQQRTSSKDVIQGTPDMRPIELESGERAYLCSLCQKVCRSKQASIYHRMIHTGEKPYKCVICDKRCRSQANLELHKKMHVNELRNESGSLKRRHRMMRNSEDGLVGAGDEPPMVETNNGSGDATSAAAAAMMASSGLGMLSMMMMGSSAGGESSSMDSSMQKWRAYADMKNLLCTHCNYKFKSVQALTYHCMIHTNEKPYKCQVCSNSFRSKTNLNLHEKSHQRAGEGGGSAVGLGNNTSYDDNMDITLETLQNCPEVANGFLNASSGSVGGVTAGTSRNASPTNCFCSVCEKTFRTEGYVRHHQLLVHTVRSDVNVTELPTLIPSQDGYMYKCDQCQNCFRTKQYYYFHVNTHHSEDGGELRERGMIALNDNIN